MLASYPHIFHDTETINNKLTKFETYTNKTSPNSKFIKQCYGVIKIPKAKALLRPEHIVWWIVRIA